MPNAIGKVTRSPHRRSHGSPTGCLAEGEVPAGKPRGRRRGWSSEMGRADARKAFSLRRRGMTYDQIAAHLGVSKSWAWKLAQQPIAAASPQALKTALTQCEMIVRELARQPGGTSLDTILAIQSRLCALVAHQGPRSTQS